MTTAVVVYRSHTGTTRRYGEAIAAHLAAKGMEARAASIGDVNPAELAGADLVLLGCWTEGLFIVNQHPDAPWLSFAAEVTGLADSRVALFTTYKLATGSMFRRMREALAPSGANVTLELKSRSAALSDADKAALEAWATVTGT